MFDLQSYVIDNWYKPHQCMGHLLSRCFVFAGPCPEEH